MERVSWPENLRDMLIRCHEFGNFELSSGNRSGDYFDLAPLLLSPWGLGVVCDEVEVKRIMLDEEIDAIGCLELCPVPLVGALLTSEGYSVKRGFIVRKGRKGYGTDNLIEGNLMLGDRVAIFEDVTSTGESVMHAVRAVEEFGCRVSVILAIINRQEGCDELLRGYNFRWLFTKSELERK